jgi:hypothetical protein
MTRTQIQLPDRLYARAKRFAAERELSLAELTRRGLELLLDRYPEAGTSRPWQLPVVDGGGVLVPLSEVRALARDEEATRGRRRR